ncbi:MAG TPA: hypothetical protein P5548_03875 [Candidatus Moranbacteria bacterium]|nr:hypothetical protein [Candidatus Moranbacteria bacterium]
MKIKKPSKKNHEENKEELRKIIGNYPICSFDEIFEMFGDHEYYFLLAMASLYEEGSIDSRWNNKNEKVEFLTQTSGR